VTLDPMAVASAGPAAPEPVWFALCADPESVSIGRRFVRELFADEGADADYAYAVTLIASELLTNALRACQALMADGAMRWKGHDKPIKLGVVATDRWLHLRVTDPDPRPLPEMVDHGLLEESGRGLGIVDALTGARWVTYAQCEKTVHVALAAPGVELTPAELMALRDAP
jgi:anti-sigma regulatory factor (Ser/Thr protein kinase)